jgi:hypothetical protein
MNPYAEIFVPTTTTRCECGECPEECPGCESGADCDEAHLMCDGEYHPECYCMVRHATKLKHVIPSIPPPTYDESQRLAAKKRPTSRLARPDWGDAYELSVKWHSQGRPRRNRSSNSRTIVLTLDDLDADEMEQYAEALANGSIEDELGLRQASGAPLPRSESYTANNGRHITHASCC